MSICSKRIQELIERSGMSYQALEKSTGIKKSSLQRYASGTTEKIPLTALVRLSSFFNVPVSYLLTGDIPNGFSFDYEENPYALEIADTLESLEIDAQIYIRDWVTDFAKNPARTRSSPSEPQLTEGERTLLNLFRQVPKEQQEMVLQMIRAALGR